MIPKPYKSEIDFSSAKDYPFSQSIIYCVGIKLQTNNSVKAAKDKENTTSVKINHFVANHGITSDKNIQPINFNHITTELNSKRDRGAH